MSTSVFSNSQKTKATRTSAPKSRNGCFVCKARRMKCDERRPSCHACIKSSRHCQYKNQTTDSNYKYKKARVILPQNESTSTLSQNRPSQKLNFIDQREEYYFWAYQEEAAQQLTGVLKCSPWIRGMLQACHTEPFVLRCVVAIGALNKSIMFAHKASQCSDSESFQKDYERMEIQHREFALASYDKAIVGMRQIQLDPDGPLTLRKALIACLLVHCIELHLRSPVVAYAQTHTGYSLMQRWIANNRYRSTGLASPNGNEIEDELFHEMTRMETNYARWAPPNDLESLIMRRQEASEAVRDMPLRFCSLEDARAYQELLVRRTIYLIGETYARITVSKAELRHPPTADSPGEIVDPCYIPTRLLPERDAYIADLRRWCDTFRPMMGKLLSSSDPKDAVGASLLMIEALHSEIVLAGAFFTEECSYDNFLPHYQEIISLSRIVSQRASELIPKDAPRFKVTAGNLWSLYETALTCRDTILRQEAISILRSKAESETKSYMSALVMCASFTVALEEKGRRKDGFIPESSRYRKLSVQATHEDASGAFTFICARKLGYSIGRAYPADRDWKTRTFSCAQRATMTTEPLDDTPWPSALASVKPNFLKWREVQKELLEATSGN